jgi:hypothetical protein
VIDPRDEEIVFRSLAAPGLEEDDLFIALNGLPTPGSFWGDGWTPSPGRSGDGPWDQEAERRRRHEEMLRRWADS